MIPPKTTPSDRSVKSDESDSFKPFITGVELIALERQRQVKKEHWTAKHDDKHICGQLSDAASVYAMNPGYRNRRVTGGCGTETVASELWPWDGEWWKPKGGRVRQLVKAGALIAAEIDRLNRLHRLSNVALRKGGKRVAKSKVFDIHYGRRSPRARLRFCERECGGLSTCGISNRCANWVDRCF